TCKASWVARVFGVNERAVKRARGELHRIGWLNAIESPHWHRNRFGLRVEVNMNWAETEKSPCTPLSTIKKSPPDSNQNLLAEYKNQNPAQRRPAGNCEKIAAIPTAPRIKSVRMEDLREPMRLLELFRQSVRVGLVRESEADRLSFFAVAEHSLSVGT